MTATTRIKALIGTAAIYSGCLKILLSILARKKTSMILMYHRVENPEKLKIPIEPGMYVTPETFEKHIRFLKRYFSIVSLEEIHNKQFKSLDKKPFCAITFDDGWLDFNQNALPIINKHSIPVTVFLPTGYIGANERFWTDKLADILFRIEDPGLRIDISKFTLNARTILGLSGTYSQRLDEAIKMMKLLDVEQIEQVMNELSIGLGITLEHHDRVFLNWEEVKKLSQSKLVCFGSHTQGHYLLTSLKPENVSKELINSKNDLLKHGVVNENFISFCFPNGNYNDFIVSLVKKTGYDLSVTTEFGLNKFTEDNFRLKRVELHEDISADSGSVAFHIISAIKAKMLF